MWPPISSRGFNLNYGWRTIPIFRKPGIFASDGGIPPWIGRPGGCAATAARGVKTNSIPVGNVERTAMHDRESLLTLSEGCHCGSEVRAPSLVMPLSRPVMTITDRQLQECYHGNLASGCDFPDDVRPVYALIMAHDLFRMLEGPHSARVHEAIQHLLLPALRPALRHWYQCFSADTSAEAAEFRNYLSRLAGEKL
jgi:hypothetical protein